MGPWDDVWPAALQQRLRRAGRLGEEAVGLADPTSSYSPPSKDGALFSIEGLYPLYLYPLCTKNLYLRGICSIVYDITYHADWDEDTIGQ